VPNFFLSNASTPLLALLPSLLTAASHSIHPAAAPAAPHARTPRQQAVPQVAPVDHDASAFAQDASPGARAALVSALPSAVLGSDTQHAALLASVHSGGVGAVVARRLAAIVAVSSRWQGIKGIATAGGRKSAAYIAAKLRKGLLRG
jgi:Phosphatidate cytidylyltransferase, mitochondrial